LIEFFRSSGLHPRGFFLMINGYCYDRSSYIIVRWDTSYNKILIYCVYIGTSTRIITITECDDVPCSQRRPHTAWLTCCIFRIPPTYIMWYYYTMHSVNKHFRIRNSPIVGGRRRRCLDEHNIIIKQILRKVPTSHEGNTVIGTYI